ncbi:hypothetical protein [Arsenophonus nasoniae]|uniref:hypothetical protein n=1 Tax=Arsenophonus nasoniae TaxID=638 RepID=UPI003879DA8C
MGGDQNKLIKEITPYGTIYYKKGELNIKDIKKNDIIYLLTFGYDINYFKIKVTKVTKKQLIGSVIDERNGNEIGYLRKFNASSCEFFPDAESRNAR